MYSVDQEMVQILSIWRWHILWGKRSQSDDIRSYTEEEVVDSWEQWHEELSNNDDMSSEWSQDFSKRRNERDEALSKVK